MKNESPLVSVIICNYNHGQFIDQAVESILNQTYKNIETIIVDDGSTDNGFSQEKIKKLTGDVNKIIMLPSNRGKWFALNEAIKQANGTLITLNDADDVSCLQRIERQVDCLSMMGSYHNLCGFTHCWNDEDIAKASQWKTNREIEDADIMSHVDVTNIVYKGFSAPGINHYYTGRFETHGASSLFYRQHWMTGFRFNPPDLGLRITNSEDSDHNTRLTLTLQRTSVLKEPLYCYRRGTSTNNEKI